MCENFRQNIISCNLFDFNINLLQKYPVLAIYFLSHIK